MKQKEKSFSNSTPNSKINNSHKLASGHAITYNLQN